MPVTPCEVCNSPVNYTPQICCSQPDCDCRGQPLYPPICSEACWLVLTTKEAAMVDVVLTPFMGVGSEVFQAVKMGRRAVGCELKPTYYRQSVKNLSNVDNTEHESGQLGLFDNHAEADEEFIGAE